ncbi:protein STRICTOSIDINE SYNTHASE-LIKE 4-like isoform X2 [Typha angustifolia]|uniref:protein STRICTOSIDINE SYNTHASE-LIKE 4-like isoform X2 n=1 Tax=Typha angustifolia TaxID=59011 RepID=UPI003C2FE3C2
MARLFLLATAALASVLSLLLQVLLQSPISPLPLSLPSSSTLPFPPNNLLQGVDKLGEGILEGPEDVSVDSEGTLYTATRDGWIRRMHPNGSWEEWKLLGGAALLGISVSAPGYLLICDADKVGEEGVTTLATEADGIKFRLTDDVVEASDGSVYFTDGSSKFGLHDWILDLLEAKPHGRLLKYDPFTGKTCALLDALYFANGVALSQGEDFLVVCETWRFRCLKYWLKGDQQGEVEVFIDNLPGGPDNINLAPDGSFWIALLQLRSTRLDLIYRSSIAKRIIASFPTLLAISKPTVKGAMVIKVATDGRITQMLDDSSGRVMSFVTSAMEFRGNLYLGNLAMDFIGKVALP